MAKHLYINKHGSKINVYDINNETKKIGYLNDREAFVWYGSNGSDRSYIYFLDGSGNFVRGMINENDCTTGYFNLAPYTDYPIKKQYINGNEYMLFKMRKSMPVYYADGNKWGTVASGCYVATNQNTCGSEHPNWVYVNYVQSTSGTWVRVGYDADKYGFVDTGITSNSLYSGIALYGTW